MLLSGILAEYIYIHIISYNYIFIYDYIYIYVCIVRSNMNRSACICSSRLHTTTWQLLQFRVYHYVLESKLPLFSYGRDGHQPYSRALVGFYTYIYIHTNYKDSLLKVG